MVLKENMQHQQSVTFLHSHLAKEKAGMAQLLQEHQRKTVEGYRRVLSELRGATEEEVEAAEFLVEQMATLL
jgi:hypothetical protein